MGLYLSKKLCDRLGLKLDIASTEKEYTRLTIIFPKGTVHNFSTVLFSTHILSDVERICTDVAFLNNGKIAMQGAVADLKNVCSSHEFIVETIKADDAEYLSSVFTDAQLTAKDTLLFLGEQFKMFEVLEFITEHKILISKIERVEPSLESLFMEVVSK